MSIRIECGQITAYIAGREYLNVTWSSYMRLKRVLGK